MKVGLHYRLRNPPRPDWFRPWPEFYGRTLDHVVEMERLGFHSVNFAEHHGDPDGYNSSLVVVMTAAALRTRDIILGQNVLQLPHYHPVRLAEDLSLIDIISGGRVTFNAGQVGKGFDDEFRAFGTTGRHRPSLLEEGLEIIRRCWTEDGFSYSGRHWRLEGVRINPKPLQKPHPPMYVVANSPASMERAVRLGLNACGSGGGFQSGLGDRVAWLDWLARWRQALLRYGRDEANFSVNTFGVCFPTDDPERAWARHREALLYCSAYRRYDGTQPYLGLLGIAPDAEPEDLPGWQTFFRTPQDLIQHLRLTFAEASPDELLLTADIPGIPLEETAEYLKTFAEQVLPHLQDLPDWRATPAEL